MQQVLDDHQFIATRTSYGREEKFLSIGRFAKALAPLLGATLELAHGDEDGWMTQARLVLGDLTIFVSARGGTQARPRPELRAYPTASTQKLYNKFTVPKFPEMTVDASRPLDKIAADVKRRLIEPSAEPLAKVKELFAALAAQESSLAGNIARLRQAFPTATIRDPETNATSASFYLTTPDCYLSGTLKQDGSLYVERLGELKPGRLDKVLAALTATD